MCHGSWFHRRADEERLARARELFDRDVEEPEGPTEVDDDEREPEREVVLAGERR